MKKRERDLETWRDIVAEIELLLDCDGRTHGRIIRSWIVDQLLILDGEPAGEGDE